MDEEKTQTLIRKLDRHRDYGGRTYEIVIAEIESGELRISEGIQQPVLRDQQGKAIVGTGRPITKASRRRGWTKRFDDRVDYDFDVVYSALVEKVMEGNITAITYWMDRALGKPSDHDYAIDEVNDVVDPVEIIANNTLLSKDDWTLLSEAGYSDEEIDIGQKILLGEFSDESAGSIFRYE